MHLDITRSPSKEYIATIRAGLSAFNVRHVPQLLSLPDESFLVYIRENGRIVAGAVCEFDWNWLFFDVVWTDDSVRGKGYGTLIMTVAESYALKQGVQSAYLMTASFQARPFYEKLGYECFGTLEDRPRGHLFHYMKKTQLSLGAMDSRVTIESPPLRDNHKILDDALVTDIAKTAPINYQPLAIFLRDENGVIKGGLSGGSFWDWYSLGFLWIDDSIKGQGWGKALLETLESELRRQECIGINCDTASFQSLPFYQSQGFQITGILDNRPPGHSSYYIEKQF